MPLTRMELRQDPVDPDDDHLTMTIVWNWFGNNRHAMVWHDDSEFVVALPISKKNADLLNAAGANHGS